MLFNTGRKWQNYLAQIFHNFQILSIRLRIQWKIVTQEFWALLHKYRLFDFPKEPTCKKKSISIDNPHKIKIYTNKTLKNHVCQWKVPPNHPLSKMKKISEKGHKISQFFVEVSTLRVPFARKFQKKQKNLFIWNYYCFLSVYLSAVNSS